MFQWRKHFQLHPVEPNGYSQHHELRDRWICFLPWEEIRLEDRGGLVVNRREYYCMQLSEWNCLSNQFIMLHDSQSIGQHLYLKRTSKKYRGSQRCTNVSIVNGLCCGNVGMIESALKATTKSYISFIANIKQLTNFIRCFIHGLFCKDRNPKRSWFFDDSRMSKCWCCDDKTVNAIVRDVIRFCTGWW